MTALTKSPSAPVRQRGARLAVVGLGERAAWMFKCMAAADPSVTLAAVVDPGGKTRVDQVVAEHELRCSGDLPIFDDLESMLTAGADIDGVVVGTRCHLHTPLAIRLAETGLPLFLEKPVAISWDQLATLKDVYAGLSDDRVVVSFPLVRTPIFESVHAMIRSGRLGTVNQIQAVNNVSYGSVYVDNWYRDVTLTGGLWLQKATHDFDYIHRLAQAAPTYVTAMHSRCVWGLPGSVADDTLNQDAGSAIVGYENGQHASYSQNFLSRRSAGVRGATITGEDATVHFDWYAKLIRVIDHQVERVEEIRIDDEGGHGGGDQRLA